MKTQKIVVCLFTVYRDSENPDWPYPIKLADRVFALPRANFENERRKIGELLLSDYEADEVSCQELHDADMLEEVCAWNA